jgi:hypothetical protein
MKKILHIDPAVESKKFASAMAASHDDGKQVL